MQDVEHAAQAVGPEMRRRAPSEIERVEFEHPLHPFELPPKRREVTIDQVIPPGDEREVAVAAAVATKGHVHVGMAEQGVHLTWHYTEPESSTRLDLLDRERGGFGLPLP